MLKESCRIEVFADKLRRRSEESAGNAQADCNALSTNELTAETLAHLAEHIAKEDGLWINFFDISALGTPLLYLRGFNKRTAVFLSV